jgi:monoamine oxidase
MMGGGLNRFWTDTEGVPVQGCRRCACTARRARFLRLGEVTTCGPWLNAGVGRLHFAGEHTCYAFVGYMEGALNSGLRAARRLAVEPGTGGT